MKKFLKCLLFACPFHLLLGESGIIYDGDRKNVKKCMEYALDTRLSERGDYIGYLACKLIKKDLRKKTHRNKVFSFSIYDEIFFDVLQPVDCYYKERLERHNSHASQEAIKKERREKLADAVAKYYLDRAQSLLRIGYVHIQAVSPILYTTSSDESEGERESEPLNDNGEEDTSLYSNSTEIETNSDNSSYDRFVNMMPRGGFVDHDSDDDFNEFKEPVNASSSAAYRERMQNAKPRYMDWYTKKS